jgi:hypothetical protein
VASKSKLFRFLLINRVYWSTPLGSAFFHGSSSIMITFSVFSMGSQVGCNKVFVLGFCSRFGRSS